MNALPLKVIQAEDSPVESSRPWGVQARPMAEVREFGELVFHGFVGPYEVSLRSGRITLTSSLSSAELAASSIASVALTEPGMYGIRAGELGVSLILSGSSVLRLIAPCAEAAAFVRALGRPTYDSELRARGARS